MSSSQSHSIFLGNRPICVQIRRSLLTTARKFPCGLLASCLHQCYTISGINFMLLSSIMLVFLYYLTQSVSQLLNISSRSASTNGLVKWSSEPYAFGLDSVWHGSRSELPFTNSLKMKMSILMGICQMNLGIILSYFNARYFRSALDVWYELLH